MYELSQSEKYKLYCTEIFYDNPRCIFFTMKVPVHLVTLLAEII